MNKYVIAYISICGNPLCAKIRENVHPTRQMTMEKTLNRITIELRESLSEICEDSKTSDCSKEETLQEEEM